MPTRTERLDSLPFSSKHRRLLWGSGVGWALDAMDVGLISFVMAALAVQWDLSKTQLSWIGSIGFLGMALGAALGGLLADRIGRRQVFALTLLVYGLATGAAALSVSVAMLVVLRFIVGLGLGAELPVASTLVAEFSPKRIRGRIIVILEAFWALGWMLAALIGYFVIPASDNGWRWALAMGMVPAAYAIYVRMRLPESVRFLETKGRVAEAEAIVREFEVAAGKGLRLLMSRLVPGLRALLRVLEPWLSRRLRWREIMSPSGLPAYGHAPPRCGQCGSASTSLTTVPSSGCRVCWWTAASTSSTPLATP